MSTGNQGLEMLADAIAERVAARLHRDEQPRLMTVPEAAEYLGISIRTLQYKISAGTICHIRDGRSVRLDRRKLDEWIDARRQGKDDGKA